MSEDKSKAYISLATQLGQLLSVARLYNPDHPVFKEKAKDVFSEIERFTVGNQSLILSEVEGILFINGEKIETKNSVITRFSENLHRLKLGSIGLEPGVDVTELGILIRLLHMKTQSMDGEQIKEYFLKNGAKHVIPRMATYKLVGEDEQIVKEGETFKVDDIPAEIVSQFAGELKNGVLGERLERKEKGYIALAHDSKFLAGLAADMMKEIQGAEDVGKVLWMVGDYLIDEITTAKQQELNGRILEDVEKQLLALWEQKEEKARWKDESQKTFVAISAAMELKGLLLLYQKHKKGAEHIAKKIAALLETLPPESRISRTVREKLKKIGPPSLDLLFPTTGT